MGGAAFALDSRTCVDVLSRGLSSPLTVGGKECKITLCDMQSGSATHVLQSHRKPVMALAWSPRDDHLLASGRYGTSMLSTVPVERTHCNYN